MPATPSRSEFTFLHGERTCVMIAVSIFALFRRWCISLVPVIDYFGEEKIYMAMSIYYLPIVETAGFD
jgi:hypothetical protein